MNIRPGLKWGAVLLMAASVAACETKPVHTESVPAAPAASEVKPVLVKLIDVKGNPAGQAELIQEKDGVRIRVTVSGLAPGYHGIHFHEKGVCEPPDFKTAGEHLNPFGKNHGLRNSLGPHAGDMPNLPVDAEGKADIVLFSPRVTLEQGKPSSLTKPGGTALIIHEKEDDQKTDPAGNSGARVVCGAIGN